MSIYYTSLRLQHCHYHGPHAHAEEFSHAVQVGLTQEVGSLHKNYSSNTKSHHNSREEIEAEQSLHTAALLSLTGVSCLLSRQWSSTVDTCTDTMCSFLKGNGFSVAGYTRLTRHCSLL